MRVLFAEDEPVARAVMSSHLKTWGYQVALAETGDQAWEMLQAIDTQHIVLLDWMMPGLSGIEVCRRLLRSPQAQLTYVVMLSGRAEQDEVIAALEAGANDYVTEPFHPRELRARLRMASRMLLMQEQLKSQTQQLRSALTQLRVHSDRIEASEQQFRMLFHCTPNPMWLLDREKCRILRVNEAAERQYGFTAHEFETLDPVALEAAPEDLANPEWLLEGDGLTQSVRRHRSKDGRVIDVELNVMRFGLAGTPVSLVSVHDITERKEAEEEIVGAYSETERLLSSIAAILIGVDSHDRVTRWNEVASATLGVRAIEAVGRPLADCRIGWNGEEVMRAIARVRADGGPLRVDDFCVLDSKGKERRLALTINRVGDGGHASGSIVLLGSDVTEHRTLTMQLAQAQKLEGIGQLAAGVAHEINTPTQYVGDNIRFLQDSWKTMRPLLDAAVTVADSDPTPDQLETLRTRLAESDLPFLLEECPKAINESLEGLDRVAKIVQAMKQFSHLGLEEKLAVNLNEAIASTITVTRNEWKYIADVETDFDAHLPLVPCLRGEMNQVVLNLLVNAAHAVNDVVSKSPGERGKIVIATRQEGRWASIRITDSGPGIPPAIHPRIFEPFFTTKEVGKGTGQGLALAHSIVVQKHGGQIWFETGEGQGTTFIVRLPLALENAA
jgi:PAS domain S-box-containing protein